LTVVTKTLPGEIHVTNVHKKDLKVLEVVMKVAEEVVEALEAVAEEAVEDLPGGEATTMVEPTWVWTASGEEQGGGPASASAISGNYKGRSHCPQESQGSRA